MFFRVLGVFFEKKKKYLMVKKKDFARHLALHSNLADNENYETRVETMNRRRTS